MANIGENQKRALVFVSVPPSIGYVVTWLSIPLLLATFFASDPLEPWDDFGDGLFASYIAMSIGIFVAISLWTWIARRLVPAGRQLRAVLTSIAATIALLVWTVVVWQLFDGRLPGVLNIAIVIAGVPAIVLFAMRRILGWMFDSQLSSDSLVAS